MFNVFNRKNTLLKCTMFSYPSYQFLHTLLGRIVHHLVVVHFLKTLNSLFSAWLPVMNIVTSKNINKHVCFVLEIIF